jgi:protein-S-isoprenylcysteine O-methyltransferase Ste14
VSLCCKRLIMWFAFTGMSVFTGISADLILKTEPFPVLVRFTGLMGMIVMHFPLKRTGKVLARLGNTAGWGCTSRLITTDMYACVRHPHHLGIGVFMIFLGLCIGHIWSLLAISLAQWAWIFLFLFLVEEKELKEKFGEEFNEYCRRVPMLILKPTCIVKVFTRPPKRAPLS